MLRHRFAPIALVLLLVHGAQAASLTPPNLVTASSLANQDLLLVWPYAAGGPLEAMSWAAFAAQMQAAIGGGFLKPANNLSDLGNQTVARTNLGLGTAATVNTGTSGATLCLANASCSISGVQTHSAGIFVGPSSSAVAGINLAPGIAPSSPVDGDLWTTSNGLFARIGGATQQAAPYLNASWTPALTPSTVGNWSMSYTTQTGRYIQVGNMCQVWFDIVGTPTFTTASGALNINIPVPSQIDNKFIFGVLGSWKGLTGVSQAMMVYNGGGTFNFTWGTTSGGQDGGSLLSIANLSSGTQVSLRGGASYYC